MDYIQVKGEKRMSDIIRGEQVIKEILTAYEENICACWFVDAKGVNINGSVDDLRYYPESKSIELVDERDTSITIDFEKVNNWTIYKDTDTLNYKCVCPVGLLTLTFATE